MKNCNKCNINKVHTEFYKNKTTKDGYTSVCKSCRKLYQIKRSKSLKYIRVNSKTCFNCDFCKPISEFRRNCHMKDGHMAECKTCVNRRSKKYKNRVIDATHLG